MIKHFFDLLYPPKPKCSICGRAGAEPVCNVCLASLDYLPGITCLHCGKQLNEQYGDCICPDCKTGEFYYERAFSCFEYSGMGKKLIHKLKYEGKIQLTPVIAGLMAERLENERLAIDAIVPVPIHEKKLMARGFNQSYIIARELGERLRKPVADCLERKSETKEQYNLSRNQRVLNISGAFSVKLSYNIGKYMNILLVDDIYTTGSTVNECSKVLKRAGADKVFVITAATGSNT
jgi:competence protein ComFC